MAQEPKDWWDKFEIAGKVAGAVAIPAVLGLAAVYLDDRISQRERASELMALAIDILTGQPSVDDIEPIREWAISVLGSPEAPPPMSAEALDALRQQPLPSRSRLETRAFLEFAEAACAGNLDCLYSLGLPEGYEDLIDPAAPQDFP
ncbi:MAG: hypothetical protein AAFU34_17415 [Pseudomonadota bacterium]